MYKCHFPHLTVRHQDCKRSTNLRSWCDWIRSQSLVALQRMGRVWGLGYMQQLCTQVRKNSHDVLVRMSIQISKLIYKSVKTKWVQLMSRWTSLCKCCQAFTSILHDRGSEIVSIVCYAPNTNNSVFLKVPKELSLAFNHSFTMWLICTSRLENASTHKSWTTL